MSNNQDIMWRAYARLQALQENIGKMSDYRVTKKYVDEFHNALDKLESVSIVTSEFRIADSLVARIITSRGPRGDSYSEDKYVERAFLLTKIDSVLKYFEIITSPEPKRIGFHKSED